MEDIERLAAENARLKAALSRAGFTIKYNDTGAVKRIIKPRPPAVKHTAKTWAAKKGHKSQVGFIRKITKDRAITERRYKNLMERGELIDEAQQYLRSQGFKVRDKIFDRVPTYALKSADFYQNINAVFYSVAGNDDQQELDPDVIENSILTSVNRLRKTKQPKKKPRVRLR